MVNSYSSTDEFNTCANRYHKIRVLKHYKSSSGAAAERGTQMHEEFEDCVNLECDFSDPQYQWVLDDFRSDTGLKMAEMALAIDVDWKPCPPEIVDEEGKTRLNPDAWYIGKIDFTCINGTHAKVRDLKTGKRKFKDPDDSTRWLIHRHRTGMATAPQMQANARQANDYALLTFLHFPSIMTMDFSFVWSDVEGVKEDVFEFDRERDYSTMVDTMRAIPLRIKEAEDQDNWEYNPSGLCFEYCPVISCPYYGRRYSQIKKMLAKKEGK